MKESDSTAPVVKETNFRYGGTLLLSMSIPLAILAAFGGRMTLFCASIGAMCCYIFDLVGSVEGTLLAVFVTLFFVWSSLVWTSRVLLSESILNYNIVLTMGVLLSCCFVVVACQFRSMRNDFDYLVYLSEHWCFAVLPLLASTLISWFLCVEISDLDLPTCFSLCYFLFMTFLGRPRVASFPITKDLEHSSQHFVLSYVTIRKMYLVPLLISPLLNVALRRNVLRTSLTRVADFGYSFLLPMVCMAQCWLWQSDHMPALMRFRDVPVLRGVKFVGSVLLLLCLQMHPLVQELKLYSNLDEPFVSIVFCLVGFSLLFSLDVGTVNLFPASATQEDLSEGQKRSPGRIYKLLWAEAVLLFNCILVYVISGQLGWLIFSVLLVTYHVFRRHRAFPFRLLVAFCLSVLPFFTFHVLHDLTAPLEHANLEFQWWGLQLTVGDYGVLVRSLSSAGVFVVLLVDGSLWSKNSISRASDALDEEYLLPGGGHSSSNSGENYSSTIGDEMAKNLFLFAVPLLSILIATVELIVREQDWPALGVPSVEDAYPVAFFVGSSLLFVLTMLYVSHLCHIPIWMKWLVILVQLCKLLHLLGIPSIGVASATAFILCCFLPFLIHFSEHKMASFEDSLNDLTSQSVSTATQDVIERGFNFVMILFYSVASLVSCYLVKRHLASFLLTAISSHEVSDLQVNSACLAVWFLYMAAIFLVFLPDVGLLRSLFGFLGVVCIVLSTNLFGVVTMTFDPTSSTYLVVDLHPELSSNPSTLYLVVSIVLLLAASTGLLPVKGPLLRLVFSLLFSFTASRAVLGWAFPLSLSLLGPSHVFASMPSIYCFAACLLSVSASLHSSLANTTTSGAWMFLLTAMSPVAALMWSIYDDTLGENHIGIIWVAALVCGGVGITARLAELVRDVGNMHPENKKTVNVVASSVSLISAISSFFWCTVGILLNERLEKDYFVPLASLLFLFTKRGILFSPAHHPIIISACVSSIWCIVSGLHAMFIKGYSESPSVFFNEPESMQYGLFQDRDISVWTSSSLYLPWLNLAMLLVPVPAILFSVLRRKQESEEVIFVLAVLSTISVLGASAISVRLLGAAGMFLGAWRCYDIGVAKRTSNRLI